MITARPSSDLRNKYKQISKLVKKSKEPVIITVNGREDTALIGVDVLNDLYKTIELMKNIGEGLADANAGRVVSDGYMKKKYGL